MENESPKLKLVVGLGNPGPRHSQTRHNAGRWWTRAVAENCGARFAAKIRPRGELAECDGVRVFHPDCFMNESGTPAAAAAKKCAAKPEEILVAHDEVDLPPGAVKLKFGGGEAGHNGLRDISARLGGRQYWRLRIGVGKPPGGKDDVPDHVLQKPRPPEREQIESAIARAVDAWPHLAKGDFARAALLLHTSPEKTNRKMNPTPDATPNPTPNPDATPTPKPKGDSS